MRHLWLGSVALMALPGCIVDIHGGKWGVTLEDTGAIHEGEADTGQSDAEFEVTPDTLHPSMNEVLTITSDEIDSWELLVSVTAIGDIEIVDSKSEGTQLWVAILVPDSARSGPAHLIFEFADGEVYFAREALFIEGVEEEEFTDTGLVDDETTSD